MEPRDFTYWLKGFFEISGATELTEKQVLIIQDHLDLVFKKETPNRNYTVEYDVDANTYNVVSSGGFNSNNDIFIKPNVEDLEIMPQLSGVPYTFSHVDPNLFYYHNVDVTC